jgi:hypothetical protein
MVGEILNTTTIVSSSWNGNESAIRRLNPQGWNMYEIEYGWYGVTNIVFRLFNEYTNEYDNLHTIRYVDSPSTSFGLINPNLFVQRFIASLGSTTALSMCTASVFVGIKGSEKTLLLPMYSISNLQTISSVSETVLMAVTHRLVVNGVPSVEAIIFSTISVSIEGTKPIVLRVYKTPDTIGGFILSDYNFYEYINTNSISLVDRASLTFTGGTLLLEFAIGINGSLSYPLDLRLQRDEVLLITAQSSQSVIPVDNNIRFSLSIKEDI